LEGANYCIGMDHNGPSEDGKMIVAPPAAAGAADDAAPVCDERLVTDLANAITSRWHPAASGWA